jgi:hypothetical protein
MNEEKLNLLCKQNIYLSKHQKKTEKLESRNRFQFDSYTSVLGAPERKGLFTPDKP